MRVVRKGAQHGWGKGVTILGLPSFRTGDGRQQEGEVEIRKSSTNLVFIQQSSPEMTSQLERGSVCPESGLW